MDREECRRLRESLGAYASGQADSAEVRAVESHLAGCAGCRSALAMMRAADGALGRLEADVPADFREKVFARLEAEGLLPKRRSLFAYSIRWAAVPAAVAAALLVFVLTSRETGVGPLRAPQTGAQVAERGGDAAATREAASARPPAGGAVGAPATAPRGTGGEPGPGAARVTARADSGGDLSEEDREIVAWLEVLESPEVFDPSGDVDGVDIFAGPDREKG